MRANNFFGQFVERKTGKIFFWSRVSREKQKKKFFEQFFDEKRHKIPLRKKKKFFSGQIFVRKRQKQKFSERFFERKREKFIFPRFLAKNWPGNRKVKLHILRGSWIKCWIIFYRRKICNRVYRAKKFKYCTVDCPILDGIFARSCLILDSSETYSRAKKK